MCENIENISLWQMLTESPPSFPELTGDITVDTAIIGGGIAGIMTAYMLSRRGIEAIVLEANRVCSGQTSGTTGKITVQHGYRYADIYDSLGHDAAILYGRANTRAIDRLESIASERGIDCGFTRLPSYLFSESGDNASTKRLSREFSACVSAGLPAVYTTETGLPFQVAGAVRLDDQAQFNPLRFLYGLLPGLRIYENTRVLSVVGDNIITGFARVRAKNIVFACNFPIINFPGFYFARMHRSRSYISAYKASGLSIRGMYRDISDSGMSYRNYGDYLLICGGDSRSGRNTGGKYEEIHADARKFGELSPVCSWSREDCIPDSPAGLALIGRFSGSDRPWFVETGFAKWGMTLSTVAAELVTDLITGTSNPYEPLFSPRKVSASSVARAALDGVRTVADLSRAVLPPVNVTDEIEPGHAKIVVYDGHKRGVYRDFDNKLYAVSLLCPHLGCTLSWNDDDKSWDCPCHGSRFSYSGKLLDGPAQRDLKTCCRSGGK